MRNLGSKERATGAAVCGVFVFVGDFIPSIFCFFKHLLIGVRCCSQKKHVLFFWLDFVAFWLFRNKGTVATMFNWDVL